MLRDADELSYSFVFCRRAVRRLELISFVSTGAGRHGRERSPIEAALRYLATRNHGEPFDLLTHAIDQPQSATASELAPLTRPTAVLEGWTVEERAGAVWLLIREGTQAPEVGPTRLSRRRHALHAALRIPQPQIKEPWRSSLHARFGQLAALTAVFDNPTTTQPMELAWKRGVHALATHLEGRFRELTTAEAWEEYRPGVQDLRMLSDGRLEGWENYFGESTGYESEFRQPSAGAQPIFVNLFVTTVFMKRRAVYRRITERLVTARENGVAYYTARGFAGKPPRLTYVPVVALWGCTADYVESVRRGRPAVTRLWFPAPLRKGEHAYFASEVVDENITEERQWVDVDIDHHGIARGQLAYGGRVPVSGLTIRVRFDEGFLPEAVWWYAELNESERYDRPPEGDRRLLTITGRDVQHTFTDHPCQPRESYGLGFSWPSS